MVDWIEENTPVGSCPITLVTTIVEPVMDVHTYTIVDDEGQRFYVQHSTLCLNVMPNYERDPKRFVKVKSGHNYDVPRGNLGRL